MHDGRRLRWTGDPSKRRRRDPLAVPARRNMEDLRTTYPSRSPRQSSSPGASISVPAIRTSGRSGDYRGTSPTALAMGHADAIDQDFRKQGQAFARAALGGRGREPVRGRLRFDQGRSSGAEPANEGSDCKSSRSSVRRVKPASEQANPRNPGLPDPAVRHRHVARGICGSWRGARTR